jgi:hypothetical protein
MGATWWLVKDVICLPHGSDTLHRTLAAYGLMGGILVATILHPVNFVYGAAAGAAFGSVMLNVRRPSLPRGMEWKMKSANP